MANDFTFKVALISNNQDQVSEIYEGELKVSQFRERFIKRTLSIEQQLKKAGEKKTPHNAAPDEEGRAITHILMIHEGGVSIGVGKELRQKYFGKDWLICFTDQKGKGHCSRVGSDGCDRTYFRVSGHIQKDELQ